MRVFLAALMIILPAATAFAQDTHVPRYGEAPKEKTHSDIEDDKQAEKAYKRSLSNIPNQSSTDPWGTVRANDVPKASTPFAKPVKPKIKTGSAYN